MKKIPGTIILIALLSSILITACSGHANKSNYNKLQSALEKFVENKDAIIGIGVIINDKDTVEVNGNTPFPMLSVYKFPIALAYADFCRSNRLDFATPICVTKEDLHLDTYSPMTEKILAADKLSTDGLTIPAKELLKYMLQQSDNNASDIILRETGNAAAVQKYLNSLKSNEVKVSNSENDMHADNQLCYANNSTPLAMTRLINKFDKEANDSLSIEIKQIMETCETGGDRLVKPLAETAVIGHKTGTGFLLDDGRLMAINDVGYVHLPDGSRYAIAVFIENSGYDIMQTEALIADISRIVLTHIQDN